MSYLCCMNIENQQSTILSNLGINALNKMQFEAQRTIMNKKNIILLSPTGSGKTLAFLLPILQLLDENIKGVQCLIIAPSRELAMHESNDITCKYTHHIHYSICCCP
jgi:ATP-dependent RNA helicase DeaD